MSPEGIRLVEDARRVKNWKRWGPYLSERQWGTVREDYSADGRCWDYFPFEHSHARAYRWGEDGILGFTDRECRLCFAIALWNGADPVLKERLFGLAHHQGNHGEDVKETYFYLASTPTHSYVKGLYKYPQCEFPYEDLVRENARRSRMEPEYELEDTGVFGENRYFDVTVEYAKAQPDDILIRVTIANRGPDPATLRLLPTLWFRNTWSWGRLSEGRPKVRRLDEYRIAAEHPTLGNLQFMFPPERNGAVPPVLFTENETNFERLFGVSMGQRYVKDAFHDYLIHGRREAVCPEQHGTKSAADYLLKMVAGETTILRFRLSNGELNPDSIGEDFENVFKQRIAEAERFYTERLPKQISAEERNVAVQAYGGLLWNKQFYNYVVREWLDGDPGQPTPPPERKRGRNHEWTYLYNRDVISMPDKWEYPWYASWDLAFHMVTLAGIDPDFAKDELIRFLREWYMHPSGQIPACEFEFSDVNPPVHAWAAWRVYKITAAAGHRDRRFLARVFQKLLLNFTWWVNRKDPDGNNLFAGGFLGLDNIGLFDRSKPLPNGGTLLQADGTAWMAFYCGTMLSMALELASGDPGYEDMASKFFEHFVAIADAMNWLGGEGLWDENDGFYYDRLQINGDIRPMRVRSMVGLVPLIAAENLACSTISRLPGFSKRLEWFLENRTDLARQISYMEPMERAEGNLFLLAIPSRERLERVLRYMFDENEFYSPFGLRSVSLFHRDHPYVLMEDGREYRVDYEPGESRTCLFGGNSNWRGPIWFPLNYLIIEALERYFRFYGDTFRIECPTGSGQMMNLKQAAAHLNDRLCRLFVPDGSGIRPCHGSIEQFANDPHWRDLVLFHEFFHADTGKGLGASHQTGWTALIARCLEDRALERGGNG